MSRIPHCLASQLTDGGEVVSSGYEKFCLLGYSAGQSIETQLMFSQNMSPPSSALKNKQARNQHEAGNNFLQNSAWFILWP
jgi:hypothetical protein